MQFTQTSAAASAVFDSENPLSAVRTDELELT